MKNDQKKEKQIEKNDRFVTSHKKTRDDSRKVNSFLSSFFDESITFKRFKFKTFKKRFKTSLKFYKRDNNFDSSFDKEKRFKTIDMNYFDFYLLDSYDENDVITSKEKLFIETFIFSLQRLNL